jgi:hypothetical protein
VSDEVENHSAGVVRWGGIAFQNSALENKNIFLTLRAKKHHPSHLQGEGGAKRPSSESSDPQMHFT